MLVSFGAATVLITESLSVFAAITPVNIAIAWSCCFIVAILYGVKRVRLGRISWHVLRDWLVLALAFAILTICAIVCFTAVLSPPNSAETKPCQPPHHAEGTAITKPANDCHRATRAAG